MLKWLYSWFAPQLQIDFVVQDFQQASDRLKHVMEGVVVSKEVQHAAIDNANFELKELDIAGQRASKIKKKIDVILN